MLTLLMKSKFGRYVAGLLVCAILSVSAAPAMADTLYVRHNECRIDAYSMYNNLGYYHLYTYLANVYYKVYKQYAGNKHTKPIAQAYLKLYYFYLEYSYHFLINYLNSMMYLYFCEYWRPRSAVADLDR